MFIIVTVIISLFELKALITDKQKPLLIFYITFIILSVFLYFNKDNLLSFYQIIKGMNGIANGSN